MREVIEPEPTVEPTPEPTPTDTPPAVEPDPTPAPADTDTAALLSALSDQLEVITTGLALVLIVVALLAGFYIVKAMR